MWVQHTSFPAPKLLNENNGFSCSQCWEPTDDWGYCSCWAIHNVDGWFAWYSSLASDIKDGSWVWTSGLVVWSKESCAKIVDSPFKLWLLWQIVYTINWEDVYSDVIILKVEKISQWEVQVVIEWGNTKYRFIVDIERWVLNNFEIPKWTKRSGFQRKIWVKGTPSKRMISFLQEKLL